MSEEKEASRRKLCTQWVSSTEQGREFLWELLSFCGVYQEVEGDHDTVLRSLGRRKVGLHILGLLSDTDENIIFKMMKEAKNRQLAKEIQDGKRKQRESIDSDVGEYDALDYYFGKGNEHRSDPDEPIPGYSNGGAIL